MTSNELVCAVRGPIILITVGSLFALDHFTPWGFQQTWPVLLIVLGLLTLLGRMSRPGPTAGSALVRTGVALLAVHSDRLGCDAAARSIRGSGSLKAPALGPALGR